MRRTVLLAFATALMLIPGAVRAQSTDVDAVILVDTSASMRDELDKLCATMPDTLDRIQASGLTVRVRLIGITERYPQCAEKTVRALIKNSAVTDDEDWGIAATELIGGYTWRPSAKRLIVAVSDAGPASGNPVDDPGPDRDAITGAIRTAIANKVILSALLGGPDPDVSTADRSRLEVLARDMAAATGGRIFVSRDPADVPDAIKQLIAAAVETTAGLTTIAAAIPTPGKVSLDPGVLLTNGALAVLAAGLFLLTALLADEAFSRAQTRGLPSNRVTDVVGGAAGRARRALGIVATPSAWPIGSTVIRHIATGVLFAALLALTAIIGSFLDRDFQPNTPRGIATTVSILAAFGIVSLAVTFGGRLAARSMSVTSGLRIHPGAVLIVALWVLIARSLGFLPGFLIGMPAGLALITAESDPERNLRIGRASIFAAIIVGVVAWLLSLPVEALLTQLSGNLSSDVTSAASTFVGGILSALLTAFLIAVQFALVNLIPIGSLTGRAWLAQRRLVWGVVFAVVMFIALHTLFNQNRAGLDALRNPGLLPLGAILATYSGVTLVAWLLTNESRIREQQTLNRKSALVAGVLIVTWLGGIACVALSALASTINSTTILVAAGIVVVVGVGILGIVRTRARRASPPSSGV